jgi:hypothetical protein
MNEDVASDDDQTLRTRPILGVGRGRMIVIACALGIVFPVAIMRSHGDALVERWSATQRAVDGNTFWAWAAFFGSPFFWFTASVIAFGVAAAFNWSNTARWTGMMALGVMWSGLADIAVAGEALGTATVGAAACVVTLWQPRLWPFCAALALVTATGRMIASGSSVSAAVVGLFLGVMGVLIIEFGWYSAAPRTPPIRGANPQS